MDDKNNIDDDNNDTFIIAVIVIWIIIFILFKKYKNGFFTSKNIKEDNIVISKSSNIKINTNKTILQIFKNISSNEYRDNTALKIYRDTIWATITFKQYYDNCIRFATALNKNCITKCNVGIIGFNCPAWFYCYFGTMMASNGLPIGIYSTSSSEIIEHIINECNIRVLLLEDEKQLDKIKKIKNTNLELIIMYSKPPNDYIIDIPIISFVEFMNNVNKIEIQNFNITLPSLDDIATIIYTSGTTNNLPKGVEVSHSMIINLLSSIMIEINNSDLNISMGEERFVSYLPLNHIAGQLMDLYLPIVIGGSVWFADKNALKTETSLINTLTTARPTIFIGIPRVWEKIANGITENIKIGPFTKIVQLITPNEIILKKIGLNKCKLCIT